MKRNFKCPECGRFMSQPTAYVNGFGDVIDVTATCTVHGKLSVFEQPWDYEEFFPEGEEDK